MYDINPSLIEIEIIENVFIDGKDRALELLTQFRSLGCKVSIDDFGTGFSSLSYLTFLPLDKLKLDRTIIEKFLALDTIDVMGSLIALAHSLDLEVVAEGVETFEQYRQLREMNCDYIQGFYFSRPLEIEDVVETINRDYFERTVDITEAKTHMS